MFSCEFAKYLRTLFLQNTSALYNFIEITLPHGCSPANLLHVFRASFHKNTSGGLLLVIHIKRNFKIELYVNSQLFLLYNVHKRTNFSSFYHVKMRGVLRNFAKFAGKHLCQSLLFKKDADLSLQLFQKRDSGTGVFL